MNTISVKDALAQEATSMGRKCRRIASHRNRPNGIDVLTLIYEVEANAETRLAVFVNGRPQTSIIIDARGAS